MTRLLRYPRLLALLAGALTTPAFAPFNLWPLALLGPAMLMLLWTRDERPCFATGFAYGLGLMGTGVSWLYVSIAQFGELGWLFPLLITLGFVSVVALFYALLGWLAGRLRPSRLVALVLWLPTLWVLVEWLRGWFLTGFPWLQLGYALIDTPLAGYGPLLGSLGLSWLAALCAGLLVFLLKESNRRRWYALAGLVLIGSGGWALQQVDGPVSKVPPSRWRWCRAISPRQRSGCLSN
jgi:apolipoprotein N-acyltransferase